MIVFLLLLTACSQAQSTNQKALILEQSFEEIVMQSEKTTVRIFMWGGDEGINNYMDEWVKPRLLQEYNVTLERIPMNTNEFLQKLLTEKEAFKVATASTGYGS